ncbi:cytochrome P450 [Marasmius fiardii PR-910]|nr:cytochrome P450 [Marasmius fiardii PR-910]
MSFYSNPIVLLASTLILTVFLYRRSRYSVSRIRGPKSSSYLIGNLAELFRAQAGETDFKWQSQFGDVIRFKGAFGVAVFGSFQNTRDRLLISDPKAIHHILQGYKWVIPEERRRRSLATSGPSLVYAEGDDHRRHRRIMSPGFGTPQSRALVPIFSAAASSLANKWKDLLSVSNDSSEVLNIPAWTSRATLDAIGLAGFDYHFGAMENEDNRLTKAYKNLFADMFAAPTKAVFITGALVSILPAKLASWMLEYSRSPRLERARSVRDISQDVARQLVSVKTKDIANVGGNKDVMSLMIKANMSENVRNRMSEKELLAQMQVLFIAGHETTSNTLSWTLLELCRHPEIQTKLRQEIHTKQRELAREGRTEFTAEDFESLSYLGAVVKESLRYHPVGFHITRAAAENDCVPLSNPITTTDGKQIDEIYVGKGQLVSLSIAAYNRKTEIFGEDAHVFRPERWLEKSEGNKGTTIGVYSNLLTFSGGVRSCIGWRFALLELQAFLVEMISNFEFSLTPECEKIRREACGVMVPTLEGELSKGAQCPLRVQSARRDD